MRLRPLLAVLLLSAPLLAQPAPPPCPADRPVDEIIAEIHKTHSKKSARNKNPLPESICIFGWCKGARTPPTVPGPAPRADTSQPAETAATPNSSSSKSAAEKCDEAMERALVAAHNVDVGDYYVEQKNYRAAQFRYQDALADKPRDAAIYVRLGRAYEKLKDLPHALENYQAAEKLSSSENDKWTQEARAALARLQKTP